MARGYLNRPELTAERFVPDVHCGDSGQRLYRSGDLVRWLAEGEIEAVLNRSPPVRECSVLVRETTSGDLQLVAFVAPDSAADPQALRRFLREQLPGYMVPSAFVLCYRDLARHLGPEQPFYGLQLPDREGELFLTSIAEMAEHYVEAIEHYVEAIIEVQPEGPYRLGGWSMGGLVAWEMARLLAERNRRVERLVLIDSMAPAVGKLEVDDTELAWLFARDLGGLFGVGLPVSSEDLRTNASAEELLTYLHEKLQAARIVPPDLELSQISRLFATFRTNSRAMRRYSAPTYPGRLILTKADQFLGQEPPPPDLGWGALATGGGGNSRDPGESLLDSAGTQRPGSGRSSPGDSRWSPSSDRGPFSSSTHSIK